MFPVNLYLSYAFLLKLCILLVYLSFFKLLSQIQSCIFPPSKEPIIIILIWQNYIPEIKN